MSELRLEKLFNSNDDFKNQLGYEKVDYSLRGRRFCLEDKDHHKLYLRFDEVAQLSKQLPEEEQKALSEKLKAMQNEGKKGGIDHNKKFEKTNLLIRKITIFLRWIHSKSKTSKETADYMKMLGEQAKTPPQPRQSVTTQAEKPMQREKPKKDTSELPASPLTPKTQTQPEQPPPSAARKEAEEFVDWLTAPKGSAQKQKGGDIQTPPEKQPPSAATKGAEEYLESLIAPKATDTAKPKAPPKEEEGDVLEWLNQEAAKQKGGSTQTPAEQQPPSAATKEADQYLDWLAAPKASADTAKTAAPSTQAQKPSETVQREKEKPKPAAQPPKPQGAASATPKAAAPTAAPQAGLEASQAHAEQPSTLQPKAAAADLFNQLPKVPANLPQGSYWGPEEDARNKVQQFLAELSKHSKSKPGEAFIFEHPVGGEAAIMELSDELLRRGLIYSWMQYKNPARTTIIKFSAKDVIPDAQNYGRFQKKFDAPRTTSNMDAQSFASIAPGHPRIWSQAASGDSFEGRLPTVPELVEGNYRGDEEVGKQTKQVIVAFYEALRKQKKQNDGKILVFHCDKCPGARETLGDIADELLRRKVIYGWNEGRRAHGCICIQLLPTDILAEPVGLQFKEYRTDANRGPLKSIYPDHTPIIWSKDSALVQQTQAKIDDFEKSLPKIPSGSKFDSDTAADHFKNFTELLIKAFKFKVLSGIDQAFVYAGYQNFNNQKPLLHDLCNKLLEKKLIYGWKFIRTKDYKDLLYIKIDKNDRDLPEISAEVPLRTEVKPLEGGFPYTPIKWE